MKLATTLALTAALIAGSAMPAAAAREKPAAASGYQPKLSEKYRAAAGPTQAAITAGDASAKDKLAALDALSNSPDEKYTTAQLRLQLAQKTNDQALMAQAVDGMIASGSAQAQPNLGRLYSAAAQNAFNSNDNARAIDYLNKAVAAGGANSDTYVLLAESNFRTKQYQPGLAALDQAIAAKKAEGQPVPETWYKRGSSVAYGAKLPDAMRWTAMEVRAYPTKENWRSALVVYRDAGARDNQMTLDIYRLMRATGSIAGERDYYEYAALANDRGLPGEAKSVIEEAWASGVPRSSSALSQIYAAANTKLAADRASLAASERQAAAAATGRVAANTGDAYLAYGDYAKAASLYRLALQKGGVDADQVNLRLGIALARGGDQAGARTALGAVKGQRAELASFWSLYLDAKPA